MKIRKREKNRRFKDIIIYSSKNFKRFVNKIIYKTEKNGKVKITYGYGMVNKSKIIDYYDYNKYTLNANIITGMNVGTLKTHCNC